jgi:hypothetical protein
VCILQILPYEHQAKEGIFWLILHLLCLNSLDKSTSLADDGDGGGDDGGDVNDSSQ